MKDTEVLIIYYSCSGQTRKLVNAFAAGLQEGGVEVDWHSLRPTDKIPYPAGTLAGALWMMVWTFLRRRTAIDAVDPAVVKHYQIIILAGPTWSYNPSGPVLALFEERERLFLHRLVLPLISCRSYWRLHYWQLRAMLRRSGARVLSPLVFKHPGREPWRSIGVFLHLAGRRPEAEASWPGRYCTGFGHSHEQLEDARRMGRSFAEKVLGGGYESGAPPSP